MPSGRACTACKSSKVACKWPNGLPTILLHIMDEWNRQEAEKALREQGISRTSGLSYLIHKFLKSMNSPKAQ